MLHIYTAAKLLRRFRTRLEEALQSKASKNEAVADTLALKSTKRDGLTTPFSVPVDLKAAPAVVEKNHPSELVFPFGKRLRQTAQ